MDIGNSKNYLGIIHARIKKYTPEKSLSYVHATSHTGICLAVLNSRSYVQVRSNFPKPTGILELGTRLALSKNGNTLAACASIFGSPPVQNSTYWSRWAVVCPVDRRAHV